MSTNVSHRARYCIDKRLAVDLLNVLVLLKTRLDKLFGIGYLKSVASIYGHLSSRHLSGYTHHLFENMHLFILVGLAALILCGYGMLLMQYFFTKSTNFIIIMLLSSQQSCIALCYVVSRF